MSYDMKNFTLQLSTIMIFITRYKFQKESGKYTNNVQVAYITEIYHHICHDEHNGNTLNSTELRTTAIIEIVNYVMVTETTEIMVKQY